MNPIKWEQIEALLHRVRKPGRYVGGEFNSVHKAWDATDVHVCLAFPDIYELGMSNFAIALFYDILNRQPRVMAERTYLPAPDMIEQMREAHIPLYTLESYAPVAAFDLLAISTAYEQLFTNTLELMDMAGIPIRSKDRTTEHPLVIGGGHGTFNPEPITDFFDAFVIGEGESIIVEIVDAIREAGNLPRDDLLHRLLSIPGLYIPRFYHEAYAPTGELSAVESITSDAPHPIKKRLMATLPPTPVHQLVPNIDTIHNRGVVEIQRGCTRGCRFCQAGAITRPVRERPAKEIVDTIVSIAKTTGYEEVALLSLSSADHSEIAPLLENLQTAFTDYPLTFSLPSLRIESFSVNLADSLSRGRHSGFTFAPEAGSDALRRRINKDIPTEDLLTVAEEVFTRGWRTIKLYFMIGLPGETDDDVQAIVDLARQVRSIGARVGGRKTEVHVSISTFVPKPHTVFQWEPFIDQTTITRRQKILQKRLRGRGLRLSWNQYLDSRLEALLARGDRRLNAVVARAWELGARFDAWNDYCDEEAWNQAFEELGSELFDSPEDMMDFYLYRRHTQEEVLPWDHLHSGVEKRFFWQDYERSQELELLNDCRVTCHNCGILRNYRELKTEEWQCPIPT